MTNDFFPSRVLVLLLMLLPAWGCAETQRSYPARDVLLSQADARRVGIDPWSLSYTQLFRTASGTARGAAVTLPEIVVGMIRVTDVNASVSEGPMDGSLLGMSFLDRLSGYDVNGDTLTLRQ